MDSGRKSERLTLSSELPSESVGRFSWKSLGGAVRALVAGGSGSCLHWHSGEKGLVGGPEGGRMRGEHRCEGAAYTDFADAVSFWERVSGRPGEGWSEPRAAQPENGFAS